MVGVGGAAVGLILGVITGAIRVWMLQRQVRPLPLRRVGVFFVAFITIGAVVGYIVPTGRVLREFPVILGAFGGAVVGFILGATNGAKEVWMSRQSKRPLAE